MTYYAVEYDFNNTTDVYGYAEVHNEARLIQIIKNALNEGIQEFRVKLYKPTKSN